MANCTKLAFIILLLLFFHHSIAQKQFFAGRSDSCRLFWEQGHDTALLVREVNRCKGYSTIQQAERDTYGYSRNGSYAEFADTAFTTLKKTGSFKYGIETGVWKEYYPSGGLKYKGACKIVKLVYKNAYPDTVFIVNMENLRDTTILSLHNGGFKNINKLIRYSDEPPYDGGGISFPVYYSLKEGEWLYYSESGSLDKKEFYDNGTLINPDVH